MRLARYKVKGDDQVRLGAVFNGDIAELAVEDGGNPAGVVDLLGTDADGVDGLRDRVGRAELRIPLDAVDLLAPIPRPGKFFGVGLNYADHVAETGMELPDFPTVFAKMPSCVAGPFDPVQRPEVSKALDYEGEMGVVIGRRCRHVPREQAGEVIAGLLVVNDVSVRDWQLRTTQWVLGKSFDTHGPIGPYLTTPDEVDFGELDLTTKVNGEVRQSSNTRNLIFDVLDQISILSSVCTLEPGDIIATGTPGGIGNTMDPPRYLEPGDVVTVEIEGLGVIENEIVGEGRESAESPPLLSVDADG